MALDESAVHVAVKTGKLALVRLILDHGGRVNA